MSLKLHLNLAKPLSGCLYYRNTLKITTIQQKYTCTGAGFNSVDLDKGKQHFTHANYQGTTCIEICHFKLFPV